ncbi:hypothetical protein VPH35_135995 [Triticum aestivum]
MLSRRRPAPPHRRPSSTPPSPPLLLSAAAPRTPSAHTSSRRPLLTRVSRVDACRFSVVSPDIPVRRGEGGRGRRREVTPPATGSANGHRAAHRRRHQAVPPAPNASGKPLRIVQ